VLLPTLPRPWVFLLHMDYDSDLLLYQPGTGLHAAYVCWSLSADERLRISGDTTGEYYIATAH